MHLYIDGVEPASVETLGPYTGPVVDNAHELHVGKGHGAGWDMAGMADDVRIYDRAVHP